MNKIIYIVLGVIVFLISILNSKNQKESKNIKQKMSYKKFMAEKEKEEELRKEMLESRRNTSIEGLKSSKFKNHPIVEYIVQLYKDSNHHTLIGDILTDDEIKEIEEKLGLSLPTSYKLFLKYFGDGGYWVYLNNIDSAKRLSYLNNYRENLEETIELVDGNGTMLKVDSLLCLMTEDSNGGAWCWLTSENQESGEWALAYYSLYHNKLYYKVENFTEWLRILVSSKAEVIRELDLNHELNLG